MLRLAFWVCGIAVTYFRYFCTEESCHRTRTYWTDQTSSSWSDVFTLHRSAKQQYVAIGYMYTPTSSLSRRVLHTLSLYM